MMVLYYQGDKPLRIHPIDTIKTLYWKVYMVKHGIKDEPPYERPIGWLDRVPDLIFAGKDLSRAEPEALLSEFAICTGAAIFDRPSFYIYIKDVAGKTTRLNDVSSWSTFGELKHQYHLQCDAHSEQERLHYAGRYCQDQWTLGACKVQQGAVIQVVVRDARVDEGKYLTFSYTWFSSLS